MRPRGPSRTDLAGAAILWGAHGAIREGRGEPYLTLEAPSPLLAERFRDQVGGVGQVVGELWYAHGFESVQAVIAMLWPWLSAEMRQGARVVLGEAAPAA